MSKNRMLQIVVLIISCALCSAGGASAADITVNRLDDRDGLCHFMGQGCSLREAIEQSNATPEYDTIHLPAGRIELAQVGVGEDGNHLGDLDITGDVTIVGRGPGVSIVDGNSLDRVFDVLGVTVVFQRLTITGGGKIDMLDGGGGIRADDGVAVLQFCDVVGNASHYYSGAGLAAGNGTLWLQDSSVRNNVGIGVGGGISIGGSSSVLQIERSTISGNAAANGCAIITNDTTSLIRNSTISGNTCYETLIGAIGADGVMTIEYSTVADNTEPSLESRGTGSQIILERTIVDGECTTYNNGVFVTQYGNLESPGDTCNLDVDGDLRNVADVHLSPLGLWGGTTETHRPLEASPAVDHVFPITLPSCSGMTDQRGIARPQDGTNGVGTPCDVGAVELVYGEIFMDGFESGSTAAW